MSKTRLITIECKDGALVVNDTETGRFVLKQPYSIQSNAECEYLFIKDNGQRVYVPFNFVDSDGSFTDLVTEIEACSCLPQSVSLDDVEVLPLEIEKQLTFLGTCEYWSNTDLDIAEQKRKVYKIQQVCLPSGDIVFVEFGKDINDTNNHLILENYTNMNVVGFPNTQTPKNSTGKIPFSLCGEIAGGTLADILTELATDPDFQLPNGDAPTGFTELSIQVEYKGQLCKGTVLTAQGATVGTMTLDGGEGWCKVIEYTDLDCDSFAQCISLATVLEIPAGAGIKGYAVGVACDADDSDPTVTV